MIHNMTPQNVPLECVTPEGQIALVIGWVDQDGVLSPVVVETDFPTPGRPMRRSVPRVLLGPIAYTVPLWTQQS